MFIRETQTRRNAEPEHRLGETVTVLAVPAYASNHKM